MNSQGLGPNNSGIKSSNDIYSTIYAVDLIHAFNQLLYLFAPLGGLTVLITGILLATWARVPRRCRLEPFDPSTTLRHVIALQKAARLDSNSSCEAPTMIQLYTDTTFEQTMNLSRYDIR